MNCSQLCAFSEKNLFPCSSIILLPEQPRCFLLILKIFLVSKCTKQSNPNVLREKKRQKTFWPRINYFAFEGHQNFSETKLGLLCSFMPGWCGTCWLRSCLAIILLRDQTDLCHPQQQLSLAFSFKYAGEAVGFSSWIYDVTSPSVLYRTNNWMCGIRWDFKVRFDDLLQFGGRGCSKIAEI